MYFFAKAQSTAYSTAPLPSEPQQSLDTQRSTIFSQRRYAAISVLGSRVSDRLVDQTQASDPSFIFETRETGVCVQVLHYILEFATILALLISLFPVEDHDMQLQRYS